MERITHTNIELWVMNASLEFMWMKKKKKKKKDGCYENGNRDLEQDQEQEHEFSAVIFKAVFIFFIVLYKLSVSRSISQAVIAIVTKTDGGKLFVEKRKWKI